MPKADPADCCPDCCDEPVGSCCATGESCCTECCQPDESKDDDTDYEENI